MSPACSVPAGEPDGAERGSADASPDSAQRAQGGVREPQVLILQHDRWDPPQLLGQWLAEAGAELHVRRPYAGDEVPADLTDWDAVISLGGAMGAQDDDIAPWLPATRNLLAAAAAAGTPTLGVCLGAQLLAVATGGRVERGPVGPELGAYLVAKRDAAEADPLFAGLPLSPDVMQFHDDVVSVLPPGAVLLLSSTGYPHQAFRVGSAAWGIQFHIEATAAVLRGWGLIGENDSGDGEARTSDSIGDGVRGALGDGARTPGAVPLGLGRGALEHDGTPHAGGGPTDGTDSAAGAVAEAAAARAAAEAGVAGAVAEVATAGAAAEAAAVRAAALAGPRFGPMLDEAETLMGQVWRAFAHRFVELARDGVPPTPTGRSGPRLPLLAAAEQRTDSAHLAGPV